MSLPKVLILYTGGTIGMDYSSEKPDHLGPISVVLPNLSPASLKERLHKHVPEIQRLAHCDVKVLMNLDSAHIGPNEWLILAKSIRRAWSKYDGIVILHGTDTLSYTASALSFLLRPCLKPVVLTGAQRPLSALRTDAKTNLISAVEIAAHGPREIVRQVTVVFHDKLFQGNRLRKKSAYDFAAFDSPHFPPLATIGTTIRYVKTSDDFKPPAQPRLKPSFSKKILLAHVTPTFPADVIQKTLLAKLDALVLAVFPSGTAPTHDRSFLRLLESAERKKVPVILVAEGSTQAPSPSGQQFRYAAGMELQTGGCFHAGLMTPECAFVKTSLLLGQSRKYEKFSDLWKINFAGEARTYEQ